VGSPAGLTGWMDTADPGGSVRFVMGMGGVNGPAADRRRRLVAGVLVLTLILGAGAVVFSIVLG
jgi:hypothetical protein